MPTIEIICVDQDSPLRFRSLPLAVLADRNLQSHRSPSRFQRDFDKMVGCIYHLGGPSYKDTTAGLVTAYELLSKACVQQEASVFVEFKRNIAPHIKVILGQLIGKSPQSRIIFTTDYQFSENRVRRFKRLSLDAFWEIHKNQRLRFNASYEICGGPTA